MLGIICTSATIRCSRNATMSPGPTRGAVLDKRLDLNDVRIFVIAARTGTFSGAARELGLPTSTVSRSITRLERYLGLLLVQRGQRGVVLTDAGTEYLGSCKQALQTLKDGGNFSTDIEFIQGVCSEWPAR